MLGGATSKERTSSELPFPNVIIALHLSQKLLYQLAGCNKVFDLGTLLFIGKFLFTKTLHVLLTTAFCLLYIGRTTKWLICSALMMLTCKYLCVVWLSMSMQDPVNLHIPGLPAAEEPKLICLSESESFFRKYINGLEKAGKDCSCN